MKAETFTYKVTRTFSGYVRGYEVHEVEAGSEEEAIAQFHQGKVINENIDRDDTSTQTIYAELILPVVPPKPLSPNAQRLLDLLKEHKL